MSDPCSHYCLGTAKQQRALVLLEKQAECQWCFSFFHEKKENTLFALSYLKVFGVYISFIVLQFILR